MGTTVLGAVLAQIFLYDISKVRSKADWLSEDLLTFALQPDTVS